MSEKFNIALVGFGNIGSYFYRAVEKNKKNISIKTGKIPFIKYISARNFNKKRNVKIPKSKWVKNYKNLARKDDIDVVVELIGGSEGAAKKLVFSALKNKKHVITANKALMAKYGDKLAYLAEKNNVNLEYEAAVAAGIPIIRSVKEGLIANKINKIYRGGPASQTTGVGHRSGAGRRAPPLLPPAGGLFGIYPLYCWNYCIS